MKRRGFSTLELLIALAILTLTLVAVSTVALGAPFMLANGDLELKAEGQLVATLARMRALAPRAFADIRTVATTSMNGIATAQQAELLSDDLTEHLTETASWEDSEGIWRTHASEGLVADLADADSASACDATVRGDWSQALITLHAFAPGDLLPSTLPARTRAITNLSAKNDLLIATIDPAEMKTDPTLFLFDVASGTPRYLASLDTASSTKSGLADAVAAQGYVFAANAFAANWATCAEGPSCAQLQVIDIRDPSAPALIRNFRLATSTGPLANGSGGQATGKTLAYKGGFLYLGLVKTAAGGKEFNIIDVTDPLHPAWRGAYAVGRTVNRITVRGTYAYLATDDPAQELIALDISDPAAPKRAGSWNAPGTANFGYGADILATESSLYLARTYSPNAPEFTVLGNTPPYASFMPVGTYDAGTILAPTSVYRIVVRSWLGALLSTDRVTLISLADAAHPNEIRSLPFPLGDTGTALACSSNELYAGYQDGSSYAGIAEVTAP